jgi:hypothetical protein
MDKDTFENTLKILFREVYEGPSKESGIWVTNSEPDSGFMGTIRSLDLIEVNKVRTSDNDTIAGHVNHLRFALNLANRSLRGENAHASANWDDSWKVTTVTQEEWNNLLKSLEKEFQLLLDVIIDGIDWEDHFALTGTIAQLAHGAWHLGAIRMMMNMEVE